jgi:hypothetical protein
MMSAAIDVADSTEFLIVEFSQFTNIKSDAHEDLVLLLFRLFLNYVSAMHLLSTTSPAIKVICLLYARAFHILNNGPDRYASR